MKRLLDVCEVELINLKRTEEEEDQDLTADTGSALIADSQSQVGAWSLAMKRSILKKKQDSNVLERPQGAEEILVIKGQSNPLSRDPQAGSSEGVAVVVQEYDISPLDMDTVITVAVDDPTVPLKDRPLCKYGKDCYRKNPDHFKQYKHPHETDHSSETLPKRIKAGLNMETGLYLTKVTGIPARHNQDIALDIKDILSPKMGTLRASAQFNFMFEIPWLMEQYPKEFRSKPLLLVHGEQRDAQNTLQRQAKDYTNITLCQAPLQIMFGTHHTKMMMLLYEEGLRIVIHTANLISQDWHQKTQGIWLSPVFPKLQGPPSVLQGDSDTFFKRDLLEYMIAYKVHGLSEWCNHVKSHDFSAAKVYLIGSVPGRHVAEQKSLFGHLKLQKVLQEAGPDPALVGKSWPVVGQFSSIGSLGNTPESWLTDEWLNSFSMTRKMAKSTKPENLKLIYPSVDNVRLSLEGYPAGGSLPYSVKVERKQRWLANYFHQWKSEINGRSVASPHIKTYLRASPDFSQVAWLLITSANLSKAAWGVLEKQDTQLAVRSYELGVLFLPKYLGKSDSHFELGEILLPFDLPPTPYRLTDIPWIWDIAHTEAPDRHMNIWKPPR